MVSTWYLSPNKEPLGNAPTCLLSKSFSEDTVMHDLTFLEDFLPQETNEGRIITFSKHEISAQTWIFNAASWLSFVLPINDSEQ